MKFQDPLELKCNECDFSDFYEIDKLLDYKTFCSNCGSILKEQSDSLCALVDRSNKEHELLQVILKIEEFFKCQFIDDRIADALTLNQFIDITLQDFNKKESRKIDRNDLIDYFQNTYSIKPINPNDEILKSLKIEIEKRKR